MPRPKKKKVAAVERLGQCSSTTSTGGTEQEELQPQASTGDISRGIGMLSVVTILGPYTDNNRGTE